MKKVKFINLGFEYSQTDIPFTMNPNYYMLKSYYDYRGKHAKNYTWNDPLLLDNTSVNQIVTELVNEQNDVVCFSFFVWNHVRTAMVAKKLKQNLPDTVIVAGGPNLNAHSDKKFFDDHPFIDFVVYGDGEQALVEILDSVYENRPIDENSKYAVNIATPEKVYPHRVFFDKEYNTYSAILHCKDDIIRDVKSIKKYHTDIQFRWEVARGCPYACSFCDWSSGLHHKVKRKKIDWRAELDFLFSLDLTVLPTDANWGIYKEDIEITRYAVTKGDFYVQNLAKLNKERAFEIQKIVYNQTNNKNRNIKLSLQDINVDVLDNIDRPEISWEQHKEYIRNFQQQYPHVNYTAELIIGLPGQTVSNFLFQIEEFEKIGIFQILPYFWELLPNSPAYSTEYQQKFQIKNTKLTLVNYNNTFIDKSKVYETAENGGVGVNHCVYVTETYSCDFKDIIALKYISSLYNTIKAKNPKIMTIDFFRKVLPEIVAESEKISNFILSNKIFAVVDDESEYLQNLSDWMEQERHYKRLLKKSQKKDKNR